MKLRILLLLGLLLGSGAAWAQPVYEGGYNPDQNLSEYFSEAYPNYDKSIIYVFFNNNPCYDCPQAIELLEQLYQQNYQNQYSLLMINYENDDEYDFIETYQLSQPLEVVLVRVNDGAVFGYKKIENLENMVSDPVSFNEYVSSQINGFLGEGN